MPPNKPAQPVSVAKLNPKQKQRLAALYRKLHEAITSDHASQALTKLLELQQRFPDDVNVYMLTGLANGALGRHAESIAAYKRATQLRPNEPEIEYQYGVALQKGGELEEALIQFERTLYLQPDHFYAFRHKCSAITDLGREEDGYKVWLEFEAKYKDKELTHDQSNALAISGARYAPKYLDAQESVDKIAEHIEQCSEVQFKKAGYFQMGRLYNHLKQYDKAFDCYTACKKCETEIWDYEEHSRRIDRLIDCWRTDQPIPFSNAKGVDGSRLIFIVGMMRSGTSLTEQMVSQVKEIVPGGEMNAVSRNVPRSEVITMRHGQRYPLDRKLYTQAAINKMSRLAMKEFNEVHRHFSITDKQPYNFSLVPLIAHMFPGCKIIHCKRDALDCCLSNYTQAFARLHLQTHDLYWLGRYFADYERVMNAWHEIPEVDMIDLEYEELVDDPEGQSKRVMEFLGREWTDDILEFHKSKRTVNTASREQVRKKIYKSSVKKYTPYEHRLDELKRGIEEGRARPHGG